MKIFNIVLALSLALCGSAAARDYLIVVPKTLEGQMARTTYGLVEGFLMKEAGPGDQVHIIDGTTVETIGSTMIPGGGEARVKTLRARAVAGALSPWRRFVAENYRGGQEGRPGALLLPETLEAIGTQISARREDTVCALVIGSALYIDPREPTFSMAGSRFPSDGLITTSQSRSVFGTADKQTVLSGVVVHMLTLDAWPSDFYRLRVQRAWQLFIEAQGGKMATFTGDPAAALDRFRHCVTDPARRFEYDATRRLRAMLTEDRLAEHDEPREAPERAPEPEREVALANDDWLTAETVRTSERPPENTVTALKLGIRWGAGGNCVSSDIDLHLRSTSSRKFLHFRVVETEDGRYFKDFRTAPDAANGLEHVDVTARVDLSELQIYVNYYSGRCPGGPKGIVRAYVDGQIFEIPFHIPAQRGNKGAESRAHWVRISPAELFNLRP